MAKGKKRKASIDENVDSYRHETETRKNVVPVGLASYDTATPKPRKYAYVHTLTRSLCGLEKQKTHP